MNKKGFTLAELLVAIVILGIISGLSIPVIRGLQASQSEKRYSIYVDSVNSAAKLYTDSYSEDLFEGGTSGCAYIRYKDMSKYRLLKDIDISGISCNTNYTFVKVVRFNDKYFYKPFIGCGAKTGNAVKPEIFKPTKPTALSVCNGSGESRITVTAAPDKSESRDKKKIDLKVKLISETGVKNTPPVLDYGFSRDNSTNVINGSWTRLNFTIPKDDVQENMISQSITQVFSSNTITTPNESGVLYLVIRVTKLMDLAKQPWKKSVVDEQGRMMSDYVIVGPYLVDNTPPNFNDSRVISSSTLYNTKTPKLDLKVTDNLSGESDLRMCYAYDGDPECPTPKDGEDLKKLTRYKPYDNGKVLNKIANTFDGNNRNIRIWVSDAAGNVVVKPFTYRVSKSYKLSFNTDGGSSCSTGGPINQIEDKAWKANIVTNEDEFKNHTFCKTSKTGYTSGAWFTNKNGKGTKITENSLATSNLTVYPSWTPKKVEVTFDCNGGSGGGTQIFTYDVSGQQFKRTCTKRGYKLEGWKLGSTTYSVDNSVSNNWINKHSPSVTLTAKWKLATYTITYNLGGGSVSGNPRSYTMNTETFTLANPTRDGYNFQGWTGTGLNSATTPVKVRKGSTGDRTYNANWNPKPVYITYNANGGKGTMDRTTCYYGQNCTAAKNKFTYSKYKFVGWYANAKGTGNEYTTFKATGNVKLYAKWQIVCDSDHPYRTSDNHCYKTLAAALKNVNKGKTIILTKNFKDSSNPILSTNKKVTLDLQNRTLNLSSHSLTISNGTLTLTGKSTGSLITQSSIVNVINVSGGTLNIDTVTIHNKYNTGSVGYTVGLYMSGGTVNMNSGAIKAGTGAASGHSLVVFNAGGTFTMTKGTLESNSTMASGYGGSGLRTDRGTSIVKGGTVHVVRGGKDRCLLCAHDGARISAKGKSAYKWDGTVNGVCIFFFAYGSNTQICYENTVTLKFTASGSNCRHMEEFSTQGGGSIVQRSSC